MAWAGCSAIRRSRSSVVGARPTRSRSASTSIPGSSARSISGSPIKSVTSTRKVLIGSSQGTLVFSWRVLSLWHLDPSSIADALQDAVADDVLAVAVAEGGEIGFPARAASTGADILVDGAVD